MKSLTDLYPDNALDNIRLHLQEVLLSLRVLFGSNSKSKDLLFSAYVKQFTTTGSTGLEVWKELLSNNNPTGFAIFPSFCWPPSVMGSDSMPMRQDEYDMSCDFTILSGKLDKIQQYCLKHNPRKIRDMWYDRRNRQQWVTFWAAIIIGGTSVLLSLIQSILAGLQLRAASTCDCSGV